jgi:serine/threonine-protein kinase
VPAVRGELKAGMQISKGVSLLEPLGAGGMGAVWLADHLGLKTRVVVKFMLGDLDASESLRTRFSREAAAAAQVKSPHVVHMLDHGVSDDGVPFIVMEHLEGRDLGAEIEAGGPVEPGKVVAIVSQVAKALTKVHAAGLLHRDIKPDNIFLVAGEDEVFVKLLDFGIAKSAAVDPEAALDGQTKTGQIVGTPFYMSPEQVTAQKTIDHRSDLWALGVVAYEALTGHRPYDGPSFGALAVKIATESPPIPSAANPALPPGVDAWFARACAREPAFRFASAKEMAEAFRAAFDGVISLPAFSGDSGQRSTATPATARSAGVGGGTLELARTALDDSSSQGEKAALARSEAGVSVGGGRERARSSPFLVVGGAALGVAILGGLVVKLRRPASDAPAVHLVATPDTTTSGLAGVSTSVPTPPAARAVLEATATVDAPAPSRPDAGAPAAAPTHATRPAAHLHAAPAVSSSPKTATPRPASTEPDLF